MFAFAILFTILHIVNLAIPGVDFFIPSSRIGLVGFVLAVPAALIGLAMGVGGLFGERVEEWLYERDRRK